MGDLNSKKILAIETSFDDTGAAVLFGRKVISNVLASSVDLHRKWGGVVPSIARQAHLDNIEYVSAEALTRGKVSIEEIDYIAVTYGPGLAIALEVGLDYAKKLAYNNKKSLIPVNHMEGHFFSPFALNSKGKVFSSSGVNIESGINVKKFYPIIGFLISGNHTELVVSEKLGEYEIIGETLDDACGEAFDKVARMLNYGYPGGPIINRVVKKYRKSNKRWRDDLDKFSLPVPMEHSGDLNFSFSGLKTASLYKINSLREERSDEMMWAPQFCNEFIHVVSRSLEVKLISAIKKYPSLKSMVLGGGVVHNEIILRGLSSIGRRNGLDVLIPDKRLRTDNAAMIGVAAYFNLLAGYKGLKGKSILTVERVPGLRLG